MEIKLANELKDFKDNLFITIDNNNKIVQAIWNEIRSIISKIEDITTKLDENKINFTNLETSINSLTDSDKLINSEISDIKSSISAFQILSSKVNALRNEVSSNQIHRINTKAVNLTVGYTTYQKRIAVGTENGYLKSILVSQVTKSSTSKHMKVQCTN